MSGRDYALLQLDSKRLPGWKPDLLHKRKPATPPSDPRDLGLGEQIIAGVVKNLFLLQHRIEYFSGKSPAKIDGVVQKILAIGLYQLMFLDRIPPSAAVDEAVEQTKRFGRGKSAGLVNAVLRNATRQAPPPFPDPRVDSAGYAKVALSHPVQLFRELALFLGEDQALAFCRHDNAEPPTLVRLIGKTDVSQLISPGVEIVPHENPGLYVVRGARQGVLAQWARHGIAQVQDPTAAKVVNHLNMAPGQTVLDRCAGLGTKALQLCEAIGPGGVVVAMDPSAHRCRALREMLGYRAIKNVKVFQAGKLEAIAGEIPAAFDRILVDVPCSNSGVLARRPEARFARGRACLIELQRGILDDAAAWLKPNGLLVYSTCSIWREENEKQVSSFLERHTEYECIKQEATLPSFGTTDPTRYHDGGFFAVLAARPS